MKHSTMLAAGVLALAAASLGMAQEPTQQAVRIGTFDSRAVALAYYRSPDGIDRMKPEWDQELRDAEAAGDSARVEELKLFMPSFQHLLHQQVFSTGSICNVLRVIEDELPAIAAETSVSVIVSKWELPYRGPDVEVIDITPQILALFETDQETAGLVAEMKGAEPVPLEDMLYQPEH
ncbi:MAG: hypothetical protein M8857_00325 [marine benthic group bacterium]|nr:hypothetical protein [Gemmatimonadota bacterium]